MFLFTAAAAGTVFAIGNEDNAVSGSIGYFVLKGVKFIKLGPVEICGFSGLKQKIISLYNVYILFSIRKEISALPVIPSVLPHPFTQGGVLMTKTHQQTKIQNKCSIFCSKAIDFKMFIYYTIKQK